MMGLEKNGPITPTGVRARKGGEEIPAKDWCESMRLRRGKQGHRSSLLWRRKGAVDTHFEKLAASPKRHRPATPFGSDCCLHSGNDQIRRPRLSLYRS